MPNVLNTNLTTVLTKVVDRLIDQGLYNSATCFLALNPEDALGDLIGKGNLYPPSSQYAIVSPKEQDVDDHIRIGGGRSIMVMDGNFDITIFNQVALDLPEADTIFLTDQTLGIIGAAGQIINTLELYQPTLVDGSPLLPMGYELRSWDFYDRDQQLVGWGILRMSWLAEWTFDFSCPDNNFDSAFAIAFS